MARKLGTGERGRRESKERGMVRNGKEGVGWKRKTFHC